MGRYHVHGADRDRDVGAPRRLRLRQVRQAQARADGGLVHALPRGRAAPRPPRGVQEVPPPRARAPVRGAAEQDVVDGGRGRRRARVAPRRAGRRDRARARRRARDGPQLGPRALGARPRPRRAAAAPRDRARAGRAGVGAPRAFRRLPRRRRRAARALRLRPRSAPGADRGGPGRDLGAPRPRGRARRRPRHRAPRGRAVPAGGLAVPVVRRRHADCHPAERGAARSCEGCVTDDPIEEEPPRGSSPSGGTS